MEKNIKDYLHFYLGCECMIGDLDWKPETNLYGLAPSVDPNYGKPIRTKLDAHALNVFSHKTTLILRPLSDMTEEDFEEAGKYGLGGSSKVEYWLDQFEQYEDRPAFGQGKKSDTERPTLVKSKVKEGLKLMHYTFAPETFRYLLSHGFDLFGLIDAGLAIDKTKI